MRVCNHCHQSKPRPLGDLCEFCSAGVKPLIHIEPDTPIKIIARPRRARPTYGVSQCYVETGMPRRAGDGYSLTTEETLPFALAACEVVGVSLGFIQRIGKRGCGYRDTLRRWQVMYLLRRAQGLSYPSIGAVLNKNHTSCIHGIESLELRDDGVTLAQLRVKYKARLEEKQAEAA